MKSFFEYISESEQEDEMPMYRLSGKPHLPHLEVMDLAGGVHHVPFHSETKEGIIRYDFTGAEQEAIKRNTSLKIGAGPGVRELSFYHGRDFRHDVYDKSITLARSKGIKLMSYTPEQRGDDEPPAEPPEPRLKKARRLGTRLRVGQRTPPRRTRTRAKV